MKIKKTLDAFAAVIIAVVVFVSGSFVGRSARESTLIAQSEVFGKLIRDDSVEIATIIKDENIKTTVRKFLAAMADGYVNFELIPYKEGETLAVIVKALEKQKGVVVNGFAYKGHDLVIDISAENEVICTDFVQALENSEEFEDVIIEETIKNKELVNMKIVCRNKPDKEEGLINI